MSDNEYHGHVTLADGSHKPLTGDEANALWKGIQDAQARTAADFPTEEVTLREMCRAFHRLRDFGWNDIIYCQKDGSMFDAVEAGSSGIHRCRYEGTWPDGRWWIYDGDVWPAHPILFRLDPEAEAARKAKMAEAAARFRAEQDAAPPPQEPVR